MPDIARPKGGLVNKGLEVLPFGLLGDVANP